MDAKMDNRLRIGLLMDSFDIPLWAYTMLEKIADSSYGRIELVVLKESMAAKKKGFFKKAITSWDKLLYVLYWKLENKTHKPFPDAFEIKNAAALLGGIPAMKVRARQTKYSDRIEDGDLDKIKGYKIDVFIRLGFGILRGGILTVARYGIWSYHHGDNQRYRGGPAGFWEVFENNRVTGSILQILTEDLDNGNVLYRSYSQTNAGSVNYNRNNYYWKTLAFIPRKLEELHRTGEKAFFDKVRAENGEARFYPYRLYTTPSNLEMFKMLVKHFQRNLEYQISRLLYFQQWQLMFRLGEDMSTSFWRFRKIAPPGKNMFWADPFVIAKDNKYYIFMEEFLCKPGKGHISVIIMDKEGSYSRPVKVLERDYHLSNPFVFQWNGDWYMMPETADNMTIEMYKCVKFPYEWKFEKVLMRGVAAFDPVLFYHQQKWWLYANIIENKGASSDDELFLFSSADPLSGEWAPHPENPVVSDVRRARPAGRIFEYNGRIYRPSQDCSIRYGYGLRINQILKLSDTECREAEVDYARPLWCKNLDGVHSFAYEKGLTVIDVLVKKPRISLKKR